MKKIIVEKPSFLVTEHEDDHEEAVNESRAPRTLMVPEVRASVRERVSNLQPVGLPLPGKTTQGFRTSVTERASRSSTAPKSFRTVKSFWRRKESGTEITGPPKPPTAIKPVRTWKKPITPAQSKQISTTHKISRKVSSRNVARLLPRKSAKESTKRKHSIKELFQRKSLEKSKDQKSEVSEIIRKTSRPIQEISESEQEPERKQSRESGKRKSSTITKEVAERRGSFERDKDSRRESLIRKSLEPGKKTVKEPEIDRSPESKTKSRKDPLKTKLSRPIKGFGRKPEKKLSPRQRSESPDASESKFPRTRTFSYQERDSESDENTSKQSPDTSEKLFDKHYGFTKAQGTSKNVKKQWSARNARRAPGGKYTIEQLYMVRMPIKRHSKSSLKQETFDQEDVEEEEARLDTEASKGDGRSGNVFNAQTLSKQNLTPKGSLDSSGVRAGSADLRPSALWAELPRMFSDESQHRPSVILPVLLEEEKLFHELVDGGDVSSVEDFLKKRPNFNLNCANYQGISALHIAVRDDNEDMVQYLLSQPSIEVGDTHLFAIRDNHPGILRMILDKLQSMNPSLEFMSCSNSPEFAENVTPLILAAEAGHYEIIGLLLSRGHTIPRPHKPRCFCLQECQAIMKTQDHLSVSSGKLHIYRALSNPAYICQTTSDPLLTAFKLSKELLICGQVDTIYLRQYEALAHSLRRFAVDLIAECRTLEEVEIVLSESQNCKLKGDWTYPRLILAMDFKQKDFVAHPNVQQVLEQTWMGEWLAWRGYRVYVKALYVFPRLVSLPAILVILMFMPTSKWAKYYSLPVNKLLSNVASYLIFLCLVFVQSDVNKKHQTRDTKPTGVEIFLVIYVVAFIYNSLRSMFRQGLVRYFKFMWNIYELVMEIFFVLAFIFLITADIKTQIRGDKNLERKYWNYWDPELVSESFFVLATVMAFMKILLIFQISYHLGPLQVSLGKMTHDCAMFSVIFGIIILAFTAGLCKFYAYYEDMAQTNPETGEVESTQVNSFTGILDTFKTLFWGLFSMSSYDVADVVVENIKDEKNNSTVLNEHHLTEAVGYFAFAAYMILTVIVILNMLIATMSNTFQKVTDNVDTEWVFGRTEVYMSYIDAPVLPAPFNIIPTTHALVSFFKSAKTHVRKATVKDVEKGIMVQEKNVEEYYILMSQLVQRYFSTKHSEYH